MKVLFLTNYPSPYRVDFFNLLGQYVDLTVIFTERPQKQNERPLAWFHEDYEHFKTVFLERYFDVSGIHFYLDIFSYLKPSYDVILFGGYASPTFMLAMEYLRHRKIPFFIEADGGLLKSESWIKRYIKRHFIGSASGWFSSSLITTKYFLHYGAESTKIYMYPFTSLRERDIKKAQAVGLSDKRELRNELQMKEGVVLLAVGQMIHRKGHDVLLRAVKELPENVGVYLVGGEPLEEYQMLVSEQSSSHIHFIGFQGEDELKKYYGAADLFVMPTREDVWGLVVNEAMSYGLPVISTDRCGAALALIEDGVNGFIVPTENVDALKEAIRTALQSDLKSMGAAAVESIKPYTIENMVSQHLKHFEEIKKREDL